MLQCLPTRRRSQKHNCRVMNKLHYKIVKFITNGGHPQRVVENPNFCDIIDFTIENSHSRWDYKHLGVYGFISIQATICMNLFLRSLDLLAKSESGMWSTLVCTRNTFCWSQRLGWQAQTDQWPHHFLHPPRDAYIISYSHCFHTTHWQELCYDIQVWWVLIELT